MSRTLAISAILAFASAASAQSPKVRALIIDGQNNHDWKSTTPVMKHALESSGRFVVDVLTVENKKVIDKKEEKLPDGNTKVTTTEIVGRITTPADFKPKDLAKYDVLVLNFNGARWGVEFETEFLLAVSDAGKGVVIVHAANNSFGGWKEYDLLMGAGWRAGAGHGSFWAFPVDLVNKDHAITKGMPDKYAHAADELYHRMTGPKEAMAKRLILATALAEKSKGGTGDVEPMCWVLNYGKGRVFHTVLGHAASSMKDTCFQNFLLRGTEWAATGEVTLGLLEQPYVKEATKK